MPRPAVRFDYASVRAFVPPSRPTVYRIFEGETLVYAGASIRPRGRLFEHLLRGVPGDVVELAFYRTTTAMLAAEREVLTEAPVLNYLAPAKHPAWKARGR